IEVQVFPRGQIGTPAASIEGMQLGTIEGYIAPIDFFVGLDKRAGVFSIPFMFKNRSQANRVIDANPELRDEVLALFEPDGIVGCEFWSLNDGLYISKAPIRTVADFNGKKLRVNATPAEIERF